MIYGVYVIRDGKAEGFLSQPLVTPTVGMAERNFVDLLREQPFFSKHAGDFSLWSVGSFNDVTGELKGASAVEVLTGPTVLQLTKEA